MALVECRECKQQISDQASACPKCGAPLRASGSPAPAAEKAKKKTSPAAWVVAALLVAGGLWYFQSREFKEQSLPPLPVKVGFREAMMGPGLVLQVANTSERHLSILAKLKNPSTQQEQSYRMDIAPKGITEVGHKEGWTLASGDAIELFHSEYQSWRGSIP